MSRVSTWSLRSTGTQWRAPVGPDSANAASRASASSAARGLTSSTAFNAGPAWS